MKERPKKKLQVIDAEYEKVLQQFINGILEIKRREYHSELEPFDAYAIKVREELTGYFHEFYNSFLNGYAVLMHEMKEMKKF